MGGAVIAPSADPGSTAMPGSSVHRPLGAPDGIAGSADAGAWSASSQSAAAWRALRHASSAVSAAIRAASASTVSRSSDPARLRADSCSFAAVCRGGPRLLVDAVDLEEPVACSGLDVLAVGGPAPAGPERSLRLVLGGADRARVGRARRLLGLGGARRRSAAPPGGLVGSFGLDPRARRHLAALVGDGPQLAARGVGRRRVAGSGRWVHGVRCRCTRSLHVRSVGGGRLLSVNGLRAGRGRRWRSLSTSPAGRSVSACVRLVSEPSSGCRPPPAPPIGTGTMPAVPAGAGRSSEAEGRPHEGPNRRSTFSGGRASVASSGHGSAGPPRAGLGGSALTSWASVAACRRGIALGATVTRTSRGFGSTPDDDGDGGPDAAAHEHAEQEEGNFLSGQAQRASKRSNLGRAGHSPSRNVSCERAQRQPENGRDAGQRDAFGLCSPSKAGGRFGPVIPFVRFPPRPAPRTRERHVRLAIDSTQEFLVQPVDASWLQCNIECQEACPVGTNCRGYLNLAAEGRFEEGYILSPRAEPGRGDVLVRLLGALRAGLPPRRHRPAARDPRDEALPRRVARGLGHPGRHARDRRPARSGSRSSAPGRPAWPSPASSRRRATSVTVFDSLPYAGGTMLIGVPAFRLPREAIEMDVRLVERLGRQVRVRHARSAGTSRSSSCSATTTRSRSRPAR